MARGMRGMFYVVGVMIALLTVGPALAAVPGIDTLQSDSHSSGSLEYWIGTRFRPGGDEGTVRLGDELATFVERQTELESHLGATYHISDRTSIWAQGSAATMRRQSIIRTNENEQISLSRRQQTYGILGLRQRFNPASPLDPHVGLGVSTQGTGHVDISTVHITDPALLSLKIAYTFRIPGGATIRDTGSIDVGGALGLVINEKLALLFEMSHGVPTHNKALGTSILSVKGRWGVDPYQNQFLGVWTSLIQRGKHTGMALGFEWTSRLSWARNESHDR